MYEIALERRAERDLKRLPEETFYRIIPQLKALSENPRPPGCRKITGSKNDWRVRIGDYRIIYEIDEREKAVKVMRHAGIEEMYIDNQYCVSYIGIQRWQIV